jgi:hypothetical protein
VQLRSGHFRFCLSNNECLSQTTSPYSKMGLNNKAPGYLLPDRVDNRHQHNTRQSANILEISSKTKF